ncbi:MAG: ATP cone domain-containing protein, partial [Candidatus Bathyarchaeia archaeon]
MKIRKRDGRVIDFEPKKIETAILKAMAAVGAPDREEAAKISATVVEEIRRRFEGSLPGVEDVQDVVEKALMREGLTDVAKAYILYRKKRAEIREAKRFLGVQDELKLTVNAVSVL